MTYDIRVFKLRNGDKGILLDGVIVTQKYKVNMSMYADNEHETDRNYDIIEKYKPYDLSLGLKGLLNLDNVTKTYCESTTYKKCEFEEAIIQLEKGYSIRCILDDNSYNFEDILTITVSTDMVIRGRWYYRKKVRRKI